MGPFFDNPVLLFLDLDLMLFFLSFITFPNWSMKIMLPLLSQTLFLVYLVSSHIRPLYLYLMRLVVFLFLLATSLFMAITVSAHS
jgi:hypothetical protein